MCLAKKMATNGHTMVSFESNQSILTHINVIILTGSMRVARKHHLCEKYIMNSMEVILAAGGTSASEEMLDTVEIFFIVNEVWSTMVQALPRSPASSALVNINQRDNS